MRARELVPLSEVYVIPVASGPRYRLLGDLWSIRQQGGRRRGRQAAAAEIPESIPVRITQHGRTAGCDLTRSLEVRKRHGDNRLAHLSRKKHAILAKMGEVSRSLERSQGRRSRGVCAWRSPAAPSRRSSPPRRTSASSQARVPKARFRRQCRWCRCCRRQRRRTRPETYSVVVNNVRVQDLLFALARDAKLNVDIHPGVTGSVTLNAIDQTLPQLLGRIARQVDMRYEIDGQTLTRDARHALSAHLPRRLRQHDRAIPRARRTCPPR